MKFRILKLNFDPKCPECGSGVDRPKCFYELGSDCPRHELKVKIDRYSGHWLCSYALMRYRENIRRPDAELIEEMQKCVGFIMASTTKRSKRSKLYALLGYIDERWFISALVDAKVLLERYKTVSNVEEIIMLETLKK